MRCTWTAAALLALMTAFPAAGAPQTTLAPLPNANRPPVLSTVPQPPAGATPEPGQMSGVPLQVGDLPPGIVAVRVIRQRFQDNVPGQRVRLRTIEGGRILSAETGADGRAQFDGLRVGEHVQVRATVGSEALESGEFQIPAEGGVRLVLVAGVGAPTASGPDWPAESAAVPAAEPPASTGAPAGAAPPGTSTPPAFLWVVATIGLVSAIAGVQLRRRRPRHDPGSEVTAVVRSVPTRFTPHRAAPELPARLAEPSSPVAVSDPRAEAFERLVSLEKGHDAGRITDEVYETTRVALIEGLAALDAARAAVPLAP